MANPAVHGDLTATVIGAEPMAAVDAGPIDSADPSTRGGLVAAYGLALLFLANAFNFADRALLGIVVEPIRKELLLSDTQISVVSGFAFSLFYLIAGVGIARWVDRGNRRLILALGIALWSAATAATGLAEGFLSLAATRMLVGIGEATVFPVAMSLLADLYPGPRLSRSASIFQASAGVGIMAGSILAGLLAASLGWRTMFELFGAAGMALVLLIGLTMQPTRRLATGDAAAVANEGLLATIRGILTAPGMIWLAVGYGLADMTLACLPVWAPAFLLRSHGVPLAQVGALVGGPAVLGVILGNIVSGVIATWLIQRSGSRRAGLIVPIVALPLAAPAYALFVFAPSMPAVLAGIAVMNFMLASSLGPCVALAVSLVPAGQRGLTSTLMLIVQTLLAFAIGPMIVGVASDAFAPRFGEESLRYGLALMLFVPIVASLMLWLARRRIGAR